MSGWRLKAPILLVLAALPPVTLSTFFEPHEYPLDAFETRPLFLSGERYSEGWDQYFYFPDGSLLASHFLVTNFGLGDHRGLVVGTLVRADGTTLTIKNGRARKEWTFSDDRLRLHIASHELAQEPGGFRLYLKNASGEIEADFEPLSEPWRIGRTFQGSNGETAQRVSVYAPTARVEARYRLGPRSGGDPLHEPWTDLGEGSGFALRYINAVALGSLAAGWLRAFPLHGTESRAPALTVVAKPEGGHENRFAIIDRKTGHTRPLDSVRTEYQSFHTVSHGNEMHDVPREIVVAASGPGFSVSGNMVTSQFLHKFDLVEELKPVERFFVKFTTTPVHFRYLADYDFVIDSDGSTDRLTGKALVEFLSLRSRTAE